MDSGPENPGIEYSVKLSQVVKITQAWDNCIKPLTGGQLCLHEWISTLLGSSVQICRVSSLIGCRKLVSCG